jgi:hypothetical protein
LIITAAVASKYLLILHLKAESKKLHIADKLFLIAKSTSLPCLCLLIRWRMMVKDNGTP